MTMTTSDGHCPEEANREWCRHTYSHWPPAKPDTPEPAPWQGGPANKRDRARFLMLSADDRHRASLLAVGLNDGHRSAAACWAEALGGITEGGGE